MLPMIENTEEMFPSAAGGCSVISEINVFQQRRLEQNSCSCPALEGFLLPLSGLLIETEKHNRICMFLHRSQRPHVSSLRCLCDSARHHWPLHRESLFKSQGKKNKNREAKSNATNTDLSPGLKELKATL